MNPPKILWLWTGVVDKTQEFFPPQEVEIVTPGKNMALNDEEKLKLLLADADFLVVRRYWKITKDTIHAARRLRLIQIASLTYDNIDIDAAREAHIPIANMAMAIDSGVAEHTIMLVLALSRNLMKVHQSVVEGQYRKMGLKPIKTTEFDNVYHFTQHTVRCVYGKTIGIVGLSNIGIEVAKRARSFGMRVLYYKRNRLDKLKESDLCIEYKPLDELLGEADFVSLHIPHTKETDKLIGKHELSIMKQTAFLINTARGGIIDQNALYQALKEGVIAGAGLDVFEEEPIPWNNPLLSLDNVILTPHVAGAGRDVILCDLQRISDNIFRVIRGQKPMNVVNNL